MRQNKEKILEECRKWNGGKQSKLYIISIGKARIGDNLSEGGFERVYKGEMQTICVQSEIQFQVNIILSYLNFVFAIIIKMPKRKTVMFTHPRRKRQKDKEVRENETEEEREKRLTLIWEGVLRIRKVKPQINPETAGKGRK